MFSPVSLRLLLSCLVDADHTDTAMYQKTYLNDTRLIPLRPADRLSKLDQFVDKLPKEDSNLNNLRK
jgi:hypothetical protein